MVAKGVLGSYGIEVDTCLSGREAVVQCSKVPYNIIFLDHMMPGFDGVETLKKIRELRNGTYQELPAIALTANTVSGAREMFRSEGFTEFVPKPIERTVLERVLRKVLPKNCIQYSTKPSDKAIQIDASVSIDKEIPAVEDTMEKTVEAVEIVSTANAETSEPEVLSKAASDEAAISYEQLAQAGINVELGLDYCCGEENFYREMLRIFCSQSEEKRTEIVSLYESANWADYAIKVHALKSTSLTIGAEALSAQAKELEMAGKKGDADYIREHHAALLCAYKELCAHIAGI